MVIAPQQSVNLHKSKKILIFDVQRATLGGQRVCKLRTLHQAAPERFRTVRNTSMQPESQGLF